MCILLCKNSTQTVNNRKNKGSTNAISTNKTHSRINNGLLGLLHDPLDSEGDEVGNEGGDEAHDEACDHVVASMLVVPLDVKNEGESDDSGTADVEREKKEEDSCDSQDPSPNGLLESFEDVEIIDKED